MKSSIFITTTETIEGMKIEKYFDFISTNVVLGTNVFSDLGASFSDFFGGTSDIYQNKLDKIYKTAIDKLKQKAQALGANGIIGLRMDFDEISGKGKSMFMVSVSGMGVKFLVSDSKSKENSETKIISPDDIDIQVSKLKVTKKIKEKTSPSDDDMNFLMEYPIDEIVEELIEIYLQIFKNGPWASNEYQKSIQSFLPAYLKNLNPAIVSSVLYEKIEKNPEIISILIKESRSFDPELTFGLLEKGDLHNGILTLESSKRTYTIEDLNKLNLLLNKIDNIPNTGKIESVKSLLGGTKEKFICEKNHQNDVDREFCQTDGCWKNIKGLRKSEVEMIEEFRLKIEGLKILLMQ